MYKEKTFFEYFNDYRKRYGEYESRSVEDLFEEISEYTKNFDEPKKRIIEAAFELGEKAHG